MWTDSDALIAAGYSQTSVELNNAIQWSDSLSHTKNHKFVFEFAVGRSALSIGRCFSITSNRPILLYPVMVVGVIAITAMFAGAVDLSKTNWQKALLNLVTITTTTALVAIITDEGFFRGSL